MDAHELHKLFCQHVKNLPTDFEPYGERSREGPEGDESYSWQDCSCGCKHFIQLQGKLGSDWGVCANPASPRVGLLTFEHQGCPQFEWDPSTWPDFTPEEEAQRAAFRAELERRWVAKFGHARFGQVDPQES